MNKKDSEDLSMMRAGLVPIDPGGKLHRLSRMMLRARKTRCTAYAFRAEDGSVAVVTQRHGAHDMSTHGFAKASEAAEFIINYACPHCLKEATWYE